MAQRSSLLIMTAGFRPQRRASPILEHDVIRLAGILPRIAVMASFQTRRRPPSRHGAEGSRISRAAALSSTTSTRERASFRTISPSPSSLTPSPDREGGRRALWLAEPDTPPSTRASRRQVIKGPGPCLHACASWTCRPGKRLEQRSDCSRVMPIRVADGTRSALSRPCARPARCSRGFAALGA